MNFVEIKNKEELNSFLSGQKHSQFLQSWEWGDFQEREGNKVLRYGIYDGDNLEFVIQLIKKSLPLGMAYFYAPRGPVGQITELLIREIKKIAKKENVIFLRFEPLSQLKIKNYELRIIKTLDVQASKTLILDILGSEEKIIKNMHPKTRYNIRLSERKGVVIRRGTGNDFEVFWRIMEETRERDGFRLHSKEHYRKMIDLENMKLFVAEYEGKIMAGIIVSYFGDMGVYVHGASSNKYRNVMAPYLLQWETIKMAREKGCKFYDLNGIDSDKWPGVTRFKKGFGGEEIEYPGTFDMLFNKKYYLYKIIRKIRRFF